MLQLLASDVWFVLKWFALKWFKLFPKIQKPLPIRSALGFESDLPGRLVQLVLFDYPAETCFCKTYFPSESAILKAANTCVLLL